MIYCDTSLLVSLLTAETASDRVRNWFDQQSDTLAFSHWTRVEVASAFAMKQRRGALSGAERLAVEDNWRLLQATMNLLPLHDRHFLQAALMVDAQPRGLRSGDALHLAIAIDHGCDLGTLDDDLATAAGRSGMTVHPAAT
ncbi:type II toxin-antitoxin system VapC family toxin [Sphingomonas mollis]|uniref:Ribonuclease VapC n=1 Tax=Sphingomonas mollis TaxID=2795726 RepID=A0ABS0XR40_9SPHN|nr:type II toxin-antitoxin system VapC family toxin [Sphingomonas sp. BT553]